MLILKLKLKRSKKNSNSAETSNSLTQSDKKDTLSSTSQAEAANVEGGVMYSKKLKDDSKMSNENNENFKKIEAKLNQFIQYAKEEYNKHIAALNSKSSSNPEKKAEKIKHYEEKLEKIVSAAEVMRLAALGAEPKRLAQAASFYHQSNKLHTLSTGHLESLADYFKGGAWH